MSKHDFKVLSIDGGGLRGVIPCVILAEIESRVAGKHCFNMFDLMAGTSTGAIIALGLSTPRDETPFFPRFSAKEMLDFYKKEGKRIFNSKFNKQSAFI